MSKFRSAVEQTRNFLGNAAEQTQNFLGNATQNVSTRLIEPVQDIVRNITNLIIIVLVVFVVILAGASVGFFYAGRASVPQPTMSPSNF